MNKNMIFGTMAAAIFFFPIFVKADPATPLPERSQMQTHLKLELKDETRAVHFINTNNDPDVFTKTYVLKHADPYELRPYVINAVQAKRINEKETKVEAIKYEDGTGVLIVSAEDYRFGKQDIGMGIDEIITTLDLPNVSSSSGHKYYFYFPKYWNASLLADIIRKVGLNVKDDATELQGGKDYVKTDTGLNALFFFTPQYSIKTVEEMLKLYDTPTSEALINYTIYEMDTENDGILGIDFQAWKNGPGSDLFAIGSKWTNGWDSSTMSVSRRPYVDSSYTKFINFSPKWNSKYLDFLVAKSKAQIITSGELSIMNNTEGRIENTTRLSSIVNGAAFGDKATLSQYIRLTGVSWDNGAGAAAGNNNNYRIMNAIDDSGNSIRMFRSDGTTAVGDAGNTITLSFVISKSTVNGSIYYYMSVDHEADAWFFDVSGTNLGKEVRCFDASLQRCLRTVVGTGSQTDSVVYTYTWTDQTTWSSDKSWSIQRDVQRITNVDAYGFQMSIIPVICDEATTLDISMSNTNLIGFRNTGAPRTSLTEFSTKVMVNNKGEKFVIGGLDKKALVRSVSKVPWLGSIPGLGWIFGSESETIKKSQLVAVIDCIPVLPCTKVRPEISSTISKMNKDIDNFGIKDSIFDENDYGFDQWLLDSSKKGLDPLP